PVGEMARLALGRFEAFCYRLKYLRSDKNVALGDIVGTRSMPGPLLGPGSRMLCRATLAIDDADLAGCRTGVSGQEPFEGVGRGVAPLERVEQLVAVLGSGVGLGSDRADPLANPGDAVSDARHSRRHGDADFAGARIDCR